MLEMDRSLPSRISYISVPEKPWDMKHQPINYRQVLHRSLEPARTKRLVTIRYLPFLASHLLGIAVNGEDWNRPQAEIATSALVPLKLPDSGLQKFHQTN